MADHVSRRLFGVVACVAVVAWLCLARTGAQVPPAGSADNTFNDSHFHLTNYIQQGHRRPPVPRRSWARRVGRSTLFGIPLQQQWSYANSGDFAPTYYLQSDAPLYYYSFTDAYIASRLPLALAQPSRRASIR